MLQHIIPSKARRKVLELFFYNPSEAFYLRQIVRKIDEEVNAVKRELDILSEEKLLLKEPRLNKILYTLNRNYLLYGEFLQIFTKLGKLPTLIYKNTSKLGKLKFAVLSMKFAKRQEIKEDEIYFLLVGVIVVAEISSIVKEVEGEFGREINYTVMTEDEFTFRKKNNDPFIWRFLRQHIIMLVGSYDELLK